MPLVAKRSSGPFLFVAALVGLIVIAGSAAAYDDVTPADDAAAAAALVTEEACSEADGEACLSASSLELRQLRGVTTEGEVSLHGYDDEKDAGDAFCCFSGASKGDVCGSCYSNAVAAQSTLYHNTTYCTQSNSTCSECGGTWCIGSLPASSADVADALVEEREESAIDSLSSRSLLGIRRGGCYDVDSAASCGKWAYEGACKSGQWKKFMKQNCRATCRFCRPSPTAPPCADSDAQCGKWAAEGDCSNSWFDYMHKNCRKACGFCH